jgi:hypothetical protein
MPCSASTSYSGYTNGSLGWNACRLGWNLKPRTPCFSIRVLACRTAALPRHGSTLANGMSTSACSLHASAISSLEIGGCPVAVSASTVNTTAAIRRSR